MATAKIRPVHFSAGSKLYGSADDHLSEVVRRVAQFQALTVLSSTTDLTDSSGGAAADGTIGLIPQVTKAILGTTDATQKAELEASFGNIVDALKEVVARLNTIQGKVPAFGALTDSMTGAAADGTIGAIDATMTGVAASMAKAIDVQAVVTNLKNRVAQAAYYVNLVAEACGKTKLVDNSGGAQSFSTTFAAVATTVTTASGADTADANAIVKVADMGTTLAAFAAAIKELATKLNECTGTAPAAVTVVAAP